MKGKYREIRRRRSHAELIIPFGGLVHLQSNEAQSFQVQRGWEKSVEKKMAKLSKPQKTKEVQSVKMDPLLKASLDFISSGFFLCQLVKKGKKAN